MNLDKCVKILWLFSEILDPFHAELEFQNGV